MKRELKQRLKSYSMAAGAVLSAGAAKSAVIYTDINPDQVLNANGQFYNLDLNNDMINDFRIDYLRSNFTFSTFAYSIFWVTVSPTGANQVAVASGYYAQALNQSAAIGGANAWNGNSSFLMAGRFKTSTGSFSFSSSFGPWLNQVDKYLGLKLRVGTNTYYGWARLDLNMATRVVTIKDYAYENTNNVTVLAGVLTADPVSAVTIADVSDNADGTDLQVSFTKAADESTVGEYRAIAAKAANAASFTLADALATPSGNYLQITPNGSNVTTTFSVSVNDVDGDPIILGQGYRVFVLSTPDGVKRTNPGMSQMSNGVILNTEAEAAVNLTSQDVSNNHNVSDLEVSFNRVANESRLTEYRVIVVKPADAASFNLAAAKAVPAGRYQTITPTGSNIQQTLTATTTDKDGMGIVENVPYVYFVLSVANGTTANIDKLSQPSNEFTLSPTTGINKLDDASNRIFVSGNQLQIQLAKAPENALLQLIDPIGRIVRTLRLQSAKESIELNVMPGAYLVQIILPEGKLVERIMVE